MKTLALITLFLGAAAFGYQGTDEKPTQPSLETISWLAGQWQQQGEKSLTEELWMPTRGHMMLGLNRTSRESSRTGNFEYMRIVQEKGNITLFASPGGAEAVAFKLTRADDKHVVFENPEHDFPKRIEYRRDGDTLTASIAGDQAGPSWRFKLVGEVK